MEIWLSEQSVSLTQTSSLFPKRRDRMIAKEQKHLRKVAMRWMTWNKAGKVGWREKGRKLKQRAKTERLIHLDNQRIKAGNKKNVSYSVLVFHIYQDLENISNFILCFSSLCIYSVRHILYWKNSVFTNHFCYIRLCDWFFILTTSSQVYESKLQVLSTYIWDIR